MQNQAVIVSTKLEAALIIERLADGERTVLQNKEFFRGLLNGTETVICICGVGKANAAHAATLVIEKFSPDIVWSIGVAGAYPSSGLKLGDIVVAEREIYGDEGLLLNSGFRDMEAIGLPLAAVNGGFYFNEFSMFVPEKLRGLKPSGNFVTVSTCTGTLENGRAIEKRFNALCENMEGAAVVHVCTLSGVPVVEVRGISNIIEDRMPGPLNKQAIISAAEKVQEFCLSCLV